MASRARILALGLLVPSCFAPDAPADTDGGGTNDAASSGGSTGASTAPTTGPMQGSSTDATTLSTTGTSGTDPTETSPTDTESTATDPSATEGGNDCGNGEVDGGEECDDGDNDGGYGGCNADCTFAAFCGDGQIQEAEACDDGDEVEGDGCNTNCLESGTELWSHQVHVGSSDRCRVVHADGDDVFLGGSIPNVIGENSENLYWAQRLDGSGNTVWTTNYGPYTAANEDYDLIGGGLEQDAFVMAGYLQLEGGTDEYSSFAALSREDGSLSWDRQDKFGASQAGAALFAGRAGEAGGIGVAWPRFRPSFIFPLSGTGTTGTGVDLPNRATALAFSGGGNFVTGEVTDDGDQAVIVSRNAGFGPLWQTPLSGLADVSSVATTSASEVYAAGGHDTLSGALGAGWVAKLDSSGDELWRLDTSDLGADVYAVVATEDGAALVVGRSSGAPWMGRVSADGVLLWEYAVAGQGVMLSGARGEGAQGPYFVGCGLADTPGADGDNILAVAVAP